MKKPKVKKQTIKKVIVAKHTEDLNAPEKIGFAYGVRSACLGSVDYQSSQACQDSMAAWMIKTAALEKNQQSIAAKQAELDLLIAQEAVCIFEFDGAASSFAATVQITANGDAKIVTAMGMSVRAERTTLSTEVVMPSGLRVSMQRDGSSRLMWDPSAGAALYIAQMSVEPATEASFTAIYGAGKSRALKTLTPGEHYVFRVCAVGRDGKMTAWSPTVSFVGK